MEITAEILLNCLYLLVNNCNDTNKKLVGDVLLLADAGKEQNVIETLDADLTRFYVRLLGLIISGALDRTDPTCANRVIMMFKSDAAYENHRDLGPELESVFASRDTMTVSTLDKLVASIRNVVVFARVKKQLGGTYQKLAQIAAAPDTEQQAIGLEAIKKTMEGIGDIFTEVASELGEKARCDTINFKQRDTLVEGVRKNHARNVAGVIKTGWQGLNRSLGKADGFVAGESVFINALPHQYKTGLLVTIALSALIYNDLKAETPGKIPLIYFGSLENETFQNMIWIFKKLYYKETGRQPINLKDEQVVEWLTNYFAKFGAELIIDRFIPSEFGYDEFKARIETLEESGYEVKMAVVDYVNLMKMTGADGHASKAGRHHDICILVRNLCTFCKNKGITFVSAHPLNRDAMRLESLSTGNVVLKFGPEHLAESMDIEREVDVSFYLHLEYNHAGVRFCTMRINKHRYVDDTPKAHQFFAMPFHPDGVGILDDLGGSPGYVTDIQTYGMADVDNANDNHQISTAAVY